MRFILLLPGALFLMISCGKQECDCATLFADDDSIICIAVSGDDELNKLIAERYEYKWRSILLEAQAAAMNPTDEELVTFTEQDWIDFQEKYTAIKRESEIAHLNAQHAQLQLELKQFDEKSDVEPYTGLCIMKTKNGASDSLKAEFENGVIMGDWMPVE